MADETTFSQELASLINRRSLENGSNTPDYILSEFLSQCLIHFNEAVRSRDRHSTPVPKTWSMEVQLTAYNTGLENETVEDLFRKGWTYVKKRNEPGHWMDPSYKLTKGN